MCWRLPPDVRVLLDECVDRRLARELKGHAVKTAPQMGWASIENGRLLALAEKRFDIFITVDKRLPHQQDLPRFNIAVIVLVCPSNRLQDLKPLVPKLLASFPSVKKGQALRITQ